MNDIQVAVIAFNEISPFHLSIPCIVFAQDKKTKSDQPWFNIRVCSIEEPIIKTNAGFNLQCDYGYQEIESADIVIIPSWHNVKKKPPEKLIQLLQLKNQQGTQIVGLCLGTYVLAASELLHQKNATTHWAWIDDFNQRFPDIKLDGKSLYIEEDNLLTSAGVAAGIDCCLYIVRKHYGNKIANHVARRLVVAPHREGMQTQFIEQPVAQSVSDIRLSLLIDSIRENLAHSYNIDQLANQIYISRRTFTRLFKKATGMSFNEWLIHERIILAQTFLETTSQSIESIALNCGFNSSISLRKQFNNQLGISPSTYRQNFQEKILK